MDNKRLFASTYGHLSIDVLNSSVAMILTAVAGRFDLGISEIGFGALVYQIFAAMSQPIFGSLTDRLRGRWVGAVGLLWTMLFFSIASFMPSYPLFITMLMIGGLGSGAFHAAGLLNSSLAGAKRPTTATSIFFVGGQSGLALGPIIAGLLLAWIGLRGMPWMALAMLPAAVVMLLWMNKPLPLHPPRAAGAPGMTVAQRRQSITALLMVVLFALITLRSGSAQSFSTLLPKYFEELGYASSTYGFMLGLFALAGAAGTFIGGFLGDRYNRRVVLAGVMLVSAPFAWLMLHSSGWLFVVAAIVAGIFMSVPHSIVLVMAQELVPQRRGLVGGIVLGFMFASGSTVAWLASLVADGTGLEPVLSAITVLPVLGALCALVLPARNGVPVAVGPAVAELSEAAAVGK